jgi:hypothetical protein
VEAGHGTIDEAEDERGEGRSNQETGEEEVTGLLVVLFE